MFFHVGGVANNCEVLYWGSCPWIRVASDAKAAVPVTRARKAIQAVVSGGGVAQESAEVTQHILRGHYSYDPNCLECAQGRGVGRSPRRPKRERTLEIQVDFFFLGTVSSKHKFIVMRQVLTGLLGATAVTPNLQVTAQHIRQILAEFGVSGSDGPPIDMPTDAATDVGELLRRSAINCFSSRSPGAQCCWFCGTKCEGNQGSYRRGASGTCKAPA